MEDALKITRYGAYGAVQVDGKLLLTHKQTGPYLGLWDLPGGGIEFGEAPEETLRRELVEEVALTADSFRLLAVFTSNLQCVYKGQACLFHHIGMIYSVERVLPVAEAVPEEILRWVPLTQIDTLKLTPFAKQWVKAMQSSI